MGFDLYELILGIPIFLLSLSVHEFSHAKVATMLGDPTPRFLGRLTIDPRAHIDPMGLIALLVTQRIGWAKPVMVDPRNFKNPRKGMMFVGIAGPISNFLLAGVAAIILHLWIRLDPMLGMKIYYKETYRLISSLVTFLFMMLYTNVGLGIFNLFPFPPLDGSRVLGGILPRKYLKYLNYLEGNIGMMIILFLALTGVIGTILGPIINFVVGLYGF